MDWTELHPEPPADPDPVAEAARRLNAVPADVPGLWWVPSRSDLPELTTGQILDLAFGR
jgi:hypothetical protein